MKKNESSQSISGWLSSGLARVAETRLLLASKDLGFWIQQSKLWCRRIYELLSLHIKRSHLNEISTSELYRAPDNVSHRQYTVHHRLSHGGGFLPLA